MEIEIRILKSVTRPIIEVSNKGIQTDEDEIEPTVMIEKPSSMDIDERGTEREIEVREIKGILYHRITVLQNV